MCSSFIKPILSSMNIKMILLLLFLQLLLQDQNDNTSLDNTRLCWTLSSTTLDSCCSLKLKKKVKFPRISAQVTLVWSGEI